MQEHTIIISDRFTDSSLVYQGYGQDVDKTYINTINAWATQGIEPDLTIYIHIDAHTAYERKIKRGNLEGFDTKPNEFFQRLIDGYQEIYAQRTNVITIDGTQEATTCIAHTLEAIQSHLAMMIPQS